MRRITRLVVPLVLVSAAFLAPQARADYVMIDDFEGHALGAIDGLGNWTADATFQVAVDPTDAANQVLSVLDQAGTVDAYNDHPNFTIAEGTTGTVYFRFLRPDATNHVNWGMSDLAAPGGSFGDFEAQLRSQDSGLDVRSAGSFVELVGDVPAAEWIQTWMVIDNAADQTRVYVQSDTRFPAQTLLGGGGSSMFDFRNGTTDDLVTFFMRNSDGHVGPWLLDDLHVDTAGQNLLVPGAPAPPELEPVLVLFEDFEDGVADGFEPMDGPGGGPGDWQVVDDGGNLVYSQLNSNVNTGSGSTLGTYSLAPGEIGDFRLNLDVRADDTNSFADAGLVFGWQDDENYYMVVFNADAGANEVFRVEGGTRTQIGADFDSLGIADGQFHDVELERMVGPGTITLSIDGTPVFAAGDAAFGMGRVGVGVVNDAASFDNFALYGFQAAAIPEPASCVLLGFGAVMLVGVARRRKRTSR